MKIVIGGDSWGVREWSDSEEIHRGMWQYFEEDGYDVDMSAIPGECNNITINHLKNVVSSPLERYDYIFWFQSDPIRDLRPYDDFGKSIKTYEDLVTKSDELIDKTYKFLNSIGQKIYCIGGCSKLNLELMKKYKNLYPLIESVTEFILPNYQHPKLWHSDWINVVDKLDMESIDFLLEDKLKQDSLADNKNKEYREYFWPDGGHPNRKGHRILYDYIIENVINKRPPNLKYTRKII
jgi:hypothetical protein